MHRTLPKSGGHIGDNSRLNTYPLGYQAIARPTTVVTPSGVVYGHAHGEIAPRLGAGGVTLLVVLHTEPGLAHQRQRVPGEVAAVGQASLPGFEPTLPFGYRGFRCYPMLQK